MENLEEMNKTLLYVINTDIQMLLNILYSVTKKNEGLFNIVSNQLVQNINEIAQDLYTDKYVINILEQNSNNQVEKLLDLFLNDQQVKNIYSGVLYHLTDLYTTYKHDLSQIDAIRIKDIMFRLKKNILIFIDINEIENEQDVMLLKDDKKNN